MTLVAGEVQPVAGRRCQVRAHKGAAKLLFGDAMYNHVQSASGHCLSTSKHVMAPSGICFVAAASCAALEWGKEGYEEQASSLASLPLEFVFAADAIYIDQVTSLLCSRS